MFQPRLGIAWDVKGDGKDVVRAAAGLYYARIPGLNLASARSTNGSIGQTIFRNSALTGVLGPPAPLQLAAAGARRCAVPPGHLRLRQGFQESADDERFDRLRHGDTQSARGVGGVHLRGDRQSHALRQSQRRRVRLAVDQRTQWHGQRSRRSHHGRELGQVTLPGRYVQPWPAGRSQFPVPGELHARGRQG